jgi:hypothetical protein
MTATAKINNNKALRMTRPKADAPIQPHEDHFLSRGVTRLAMLKAALNFVEKDDPAQ